jgi:WD40 repeat protein/serine/threonine protein kinase
MSLLTKLFGRKKQKINIQVTEVGQGKPDPKPDRTGTTLRKPEESPALPQKKEGPELTALEMAKRQDWEVKTLPVWEPGDVILDTYEVEDMIPGGMGYVYIANHNKWKVKLAIKSPNEMMLSDRDFFARILREANSWIELGLHPNIAYCYYVRNIDNVPHIIVEYVDGGNLRQWIEDGKCVDYRVNLDLAIQFCHGMEHAHAKGMIHRDIKPENVLMTKDGTLKITDFGLVRTEQSILTQDNIDKPKIQADSPNLTQLGTFMGTLGYMAPEQAESASKVDERADIFSFGVCLYEMFCGNKPYGATYGKKQDAPDPVELSRDDQFPSDITSVLTKCVQWDPKDRYLNFKEIRQEFSKIYSSLFDEESPYADLKLVDIEADGLNNRGLSYWELGNKADALAYWEKALEANPSHLEATYNLGLIQWRDGEIRDDEVLRRLDNIGSNPEVDKENLALLKARAYAERLDPGKAKEILADYPGKYAEEFANKKIGEIRCSRQIKGGGPLSSSEDCRCVLWPDGAKTVQYWDLESGRCLQTLEDHEEFFDSASIAKDGRLALSGGSDGTIRLWDLNTGHCVRSMEHPDGRVHCVSISEDGRYAVSAGLDKILRLWDLNEGRCIHSMEGHTAYVDSVCIIQNGRLAVSSQSKWCQIMLWDLETGQCTKTIKEQIEGGHIDVTPDGRFAVFGCEDKTVRLIDLETGKWVHTFEGHTDHVSSVAIEAKGRYAVSTRFRGTSRLWDFETGRCIRTLKEMTNSVFLSVDGRNAILLVEGDDLKLASLTTQLWTLDLDTDYQPAPVFSLPKDYEKISRAEQQLTERIGKAEELYRKGAYSQSWAVLHKAWKDIDFSNNDNISDLYAKLLKHGRLKRLNFTLQKKLLDKNYTGSAKISADGRYAVSTSSDDTLRVWELRSGRCVCSIEAGSSSISEYSRLSLSPDGQYAVATWASNSIRLWNFNICRCARVLEGHSESVWDVQFTPDSLYAVSKVLPINPFMSGI